MSKYHEKCTEQQPVEKKRAVAGGQVLISKPFCDCQQCSCKDCTDILKQLDITVNDKSCDFGSKEATGSKKSLISEHNLEPHQSLLESVRQDKGCVCEIVARAVQSNIHEYIGMSKRRTAINNHLNERSSQDDKPKK